jgi:hypothetical protein
MEPGDVVIVTTPDRRSGREVPKPMIVVGHGRPGQLRCVGLVTWATYMSGEPRIPLVHWRAAGLRSQSYLWGGKPAVISESHVQRTIGRLDPRDIDALAAAAELELDEILVLDNALADGVAV